MSCHKQTTNALAENPHANIKLQTERNQNIVNRTEILKKFACEWLQSIQRSFLAHSIKNKVEFVDNMADGLISAN